MSYGRIRRGPMAADAFTQIRNTLFRDNRISFKAKGVFGLISTHRDGYGVTPESLAACSTDGVSAVKAALRELEAAKYLKRARERRPDGTLGASSYFITDEPEAIQLSFEEENRRSEPKVENPPVDKPPEGEPPVVQPPVDEPPVANRSHKKTNSKHTSSKKTTSPLPRQRPAAEEEGSCASPEANRARLFLQMLPMPWTCGPKDAERIAPLLDATATALGWEIGDQLAAQLCTNPGAINNYASVLEKDRIPNLLPYAAVHGQRSNLPPVCRPCLDRNPAAETNKRWRTTTGSATGQPCPTCHPDGLTAAA